MAKRVTQATGQVLVTNPDAKLRSTQAVAQVLTNTGTPGAMVATQAVVLVLAPSSAGTAPLRAKAYVID